MRKLFLKLSIILLAFFLFSCDKKEDENTISFEMDLNGGTFEPAAIYCSISQMNSQQMFLHASDDDTNSIRIFIETGTIQNCMPTGEYPIEDILITLSYITNNGGTVVEHSHLDANLNSTLSASITACSGDEISGTFSGTFRKIDVLQDEFETPEIVEISNGRFKNIPFLIITN